MVQDIDIRFTLFSYDVYLKNIPAPFGYRDNDTCVEDKDMLYVLHAMLWRLGSCIPY
jgi:predicted membrane chloride channel (bestrophin family)